MTDDPQNIQYRVRHCKTVTQKLKRSKKTPSMAIITCMFSTLLLHVNWFLCQLILSFLILWSEKQLFCIYLVAKVHFSFNYFCLIFRLQYQMVWHGAWTERHFTILTHFSGASIDQYFNVFKWHVHVGFVLCCVVNKNIKFIPIKNSTWKQNCNYYMEKNKFSLS